MPLGAWTVTVRNGCAGADDFDGIAEDEPLAGGALDETPLDEATPPRGPAPVPVPETCDAQAAPSAAHAPRARAGTMRTVRTPAYPAYGFALTSVTFIVFPLGVSYSTVSPSHAPVSALPSGEAAE